MTTPYTNAMWRDVQNRSLDSMPSLNISNNMNRYDGEIRSGERKGDVGKERGGGGNGRS